MKPLKRGIVAVLDVRMKDARVVHGDEEQE